MDRIQLEDTVQKWKIQQDPENRIKDYKFDKDGEIEKLEIKINGEINRIYDFTIDSNGIVVFEDIQFYKNSCFMSYDKFRNILNGL